MEFFKAISRELYECKTICVVMELEGAKDTYTMMPSTRIPWVDLHGTMHHCEIEYSF